MTFIDREGIFKARPVSWCVKPSETTAAVAVSIQFSIISQLVENEWSDWSGYVEHIAIGDFYVIKKDRSVNQTTVEQLATSLGWDGNLRSVASTDQPDVICQITVKADTYNGQTRYRVTWINPEDYTPTPTGASVEDVTRLQNQFGSLLRAAAAGAQKGQPPKKPAPPAPGPLPTTEPSSGPVHPDSTGGDDLPFKNGQ